MVDLEPANVTGMDIPLADLIPTRKRQIRDHDFNKLLANLQAVGLLDPCCTWREGNRYYIVDGFIRYTAMAALGVKTVPCLVLDSRDLYTPNRQVNNLSPQQQEESLRKALEQIDEETIARAFGLDSLRAPSSAALHRELNSEVIATLEEGKIGQAAAKELKYVVPERQLEILGMMRESGDFSPAFAKAQVLATPAAGRSRKRRKNSPWDKSQRARCDLAGKLAEVEKHHDFYSSLYRQYVGDLLKLSIFVRQIVTRPALREHLEQNHPQALAFFDELLAQSADKAPDAGES